MKIMIVDGGKEETALIGRLAEKIEPSALFDVTHCSFEHSLTEIEKKGEPDVIILSLKSSGYKVLKQLSDQKLASSVFIYTGKLHESEDWNKLLTVEPKTGDQGSPTLVHAGAKLTEPHKRRFLIRQSTKIITVSIEQVAYFYSESRLNYLQTWEGKSYIVDYTMEELNRLLNPFDFFRASRSFIVSYRSIKELKPYFNNRIKIIVGDEKNREEILVSRDKVAELREWLGAK